jgi:TetR/AcrR family transcriptional regulator, regulator of cefoperazone and chloramphenicol sensitivity
MSASTRVRRRTPRREALEPPTLDPKRARLLDAATEVFAERGFHAATVREICLRAGANIASINYYFRDKLGLYTEVLRRAAGSVGHDAIRTIFERGMPPENALRAVIKAMITGLYGHDRPTIPFRLMRHELLQPTPALSRVVEDVVRPNYAMLRATIGALLGLPPDHDTTRLCAHSVLGQILFYPQAAPMLALLWPKLQMTPERLDQIADHIADFSLAYLRTAKGEA